jgi:hypothetical protein
MWISNSSDMIGVAIQRVTTAFLNAYIKNDQFSLGWLKNDAQPWLYNIGQLKGELKYGISRIFGCGKRVSKPYLKYLVSLSYDVNIVWLPNWIKLLLRPLQKPPHV